MPDYPYLSDHEKQIKWAELRMNRPESRAIPEPRPAAKRSRKLLDDERLLVSAIKYPWGEVVTGLRHHHVIAHMASRGIKTPSSYPQGFVSSRGRFYERGEALRVAVESGQVAGSFTDTLHSEDLW